MSRDTWGDKMRGCDGHRDDEGLGSQMSAYQEEFKDLCSQFLWSSELLSTFEAVPWGDLRVVQMWKELEVCFQVVKKRFKVSNFLWRFRFIKIKYLHRPTVPIHNAEIQTHTASNTSPVIAFQFMVNGSDFKLILPFMITEKEIQTHTHAHTLFRSTTWHYRRWDT